MTENFKPNLKQQEAIDCINGPVMLLAGPGTGKTFTLIKRVEKMLSSGIKPENILCLTFSDAATNEMKTRLVEKIGTEAIGVNVSTYHGFCMEIIRQYRADFEIAENVQMADDVTKQAILKESIEEFGEIEFLKDKWGNKYFYLPAILSGIETIKRERTTKEEYFNYLETNPDWLLKLNELYLEKKEREEKGKLTKTCLNSIETLEKKIGKAKEFYSIYKIYERKLSENGLIDYSDMINLVLNKMEEDENFLSEISKDYKYVLVDEYQDTSKVQNEIIFNVLKGAKTDNIFVVGDDDQIIYSFQGARSRNLNDFLEKFPKTNVICLTENRRSTQTVLDFAELLIKDDKLRLTNNPDFEIAKSLTAKNEKIISKEEKIHFNIFNETVQENNFITEEIKKLIDEGIKPSEIAILARKNDRLENFGRLLKQKNIPCALQKQKNAFDIPSFIQIYFYLKILANSYLEQDKLFGLLSREPFKISDKTLAEILIQSRKTDKSFFEIIENIDDIKLADFYKTYKELKIKKSYTPLMPFLYEVITKTGILGYYSNEAKEKFDNISAIQRLLDEGNSYAILHKGAYLEDFTGHLDTYFKQNIKIELKKTNYSKEAVQLVTYHGSKGREFEHVFMPDLTARSFEKSRGGAMELDLPIQKSLFSDNKEENKDAELLRLLFVGITRAKFGLHLSYSNTQEGSAQNASKYFSNMFPKADYLVEQKIYELNEEEKIEETIKNIKTDFLGDNSKKEVEERLKNLVISQTSLNKYLNCPLQYFYSDILDVPVFIEDKDTLSYGSSVHFAIDFMTKEAIKNKSWGDKNEMIEIFLKKMENSEFTSKDKKEELIERGKKSIEKNYDKLIESAPDNILSTEFRMELNFKGTILKGFADRISKDNEGNIHIYDFKTGSYKKVRPDENYYNQLRFYKFLYEELNKDKKVKDTALIFFEEGCKLSSPEPDCTNNEEIKEKIKEVIQNIKSFNFEPKKSDEVCKFCNYKLICKLQTSDCK